MIRNCVAPELINSNPFFLRYFSIGELFGCSLTLVDILQSGGSSSRTKIVSVDDVITLD